MSGSSGKDPLVVRTATDLLAAIPYLLGFHPTESLVVLGLRPDTGIVQLAVRIDLPHAADEAINAAQGLTHILSRNAVTEAVLVGYGPGDRVTPVIDACRDALTDHRVVTKEVLRVHEGRYWSYVCGDPGCCPPNGVPFDISTTAAAAHAIVNGQVARADRDELARSVAPITGPERAAMTKATRRVEDRLLDRGMNDGSLAGVREDMIAEGLRMVRELEERIHRGYEPLPDDQMAWFGVLLGTLRVRDEAWVRSGSGDLHRQIEFWRDMTRRVEAAYVPAPACVLAYVAYLSGDGALANVALDRAVAADPKYSLAGLLRDLVTCGIDPAKARGFMTPEMLAAAYDEQERRSGS